MNNFNQHNTIFHQQQHKNAIIIFIKNPALGKVKTRLAATVGNERALEIYHILMKHTQEITVDLAAEKYLFYSDFVDENDIWANDKYQKSIQNPEPDLGQKMAFAFKETIQKQHEKVLIIGSDCLELSGKIITDAFVQLTENEAVIGPAHDGGYYLIGFNFKAIGEQCGEVLKQVFLDKQWSHAHVCQEAVDACERLHLSYKKLVTLTDVDEEKDFLKTMPDYAAVNAW